jgi:hypothetical protein
MLRFFKGKIEFRFNGHGDPFDGDGHLDVDSIDRDIEDLGDFFILEPIFAHEFEDHFAAGGKGFDGFPDLLLDLGCNEDLLGCKGGFPQPYMDMIEWFGDTGLSLPGQVVERRVLGGGVEIHPEILNSSDLVPLLPDPDKDILYYFFRRFAGLDDGERELKKAPVIVAINEPECSLVSCCNLLQELLRIIVRQKGWVIFHMTVVQDSPVSFPAAKLSNPFVNRQA